MIPFNTKKTLCDGRLRKVERKWSESGAKVDPGSHTLQGELLHYEVESPCINLSFVTESRPAGTFDIHSIHAHHMNTPWDILVTSGVQFWKFIHPRTQVRSVSGLRG